MSRKMQGLCMPYALLRKDEQPENRVLRLSEAFEQMTETPELELKVMIRNINPGMNEELKESCGILKDFLLRQRAEVMKMSIYEYDQEREFALIRRDEREIGIQQGKEIGEQIGLEKEHQNIEKTLQKEKERSIQSIISVCKKFGGNQEQVISELMEQCHLTKEQALEKLTLYENRK